MRGPTPGVTNCYDPIRDAAMIHGDQATTGKRLVSGEKSLFRGLHLGDVYKHRTDER